MRHKCIYTVEKIRPQTVKELLILRKWWGYKKLRIINIKQQIQQQQQAVAYSFTHANAVDVSGYTSEIIKRNLPIVQNSSHLCSQLEDVCGSHALPIDRHQTCVRFKQVYNLFRNSMWHPQLLQFLIPLRTQVKWIAASAHQHVDATLQNRSG